MLRSLVARLGRLVPARCVVCGLQSSAASASICAQCETDFFAAETLRCERCAIRILDSTMRICGRCLSNTPHFDTTMALADYVSPVDGMVIALKFTARLDLAQFFGQLLASRSSAMSPSMRDGVVMPVPLAFERVRQRGFNQSHHIARAYASAVGHRLVVDRLLRVRDTAPQQTLALNERRRNIRGAFAVEGSCEGQTVIVVDDVMTTGSTLDETARVLKQAGASQVHNLVVARTP